MKKTIGILAHVDAGKTTLSEQILYRSRALRSPGRVDQASSFMDTDPIERLRGITIFSGLARFRRGEQDYVLVDTPGHVDFSAEMERALSVLDAAIVVVSAVEGIQGHTEVILRLLEERRIPTLFFINKLDRVGADAGAVLAALREKLPGEAVALTGRVTEGVPEESVLEEVAALDEALLEAYLEGSLSAARWQRGAARLVGERRLFPVFTGAALEGRGVEALLWGMDALLATDYDRRTAEPLAARVYQVRHDAKGTRLVFVKIKAGRLAVKDELEGQKIHELRLYHGEKYTAVPEAAAGELCAVVGVEGLMPGQGLGREPDVGGSLQPVMMARVLWEDIPEQTVLGAFRQLEDEDPLLKVAWDSALKQLTCHVMGPIQLEVLQQVAAERFGLAVTFGPCRIAYRETLAAPVVGMAHYEPLRHYAETHLLLEPLPRGAGIRYESACSLDTLAVNYQNLIRTHVFEKEHKGVLIGAPITDIRVTLLAGRAHLKHTEGGDFRQTVYRAIRQGLASGESLLLEPYYDFVITVPEEHLGRVLADIQRLQGSFAPPESRHGEAVVHGRGPVATFRDYGTQLPAFTRGKGRMTAAFGGYEPCHNAEEVIAEAGYDMGADWENEADSVFCAKGAGFGVYWKRVPEFVHIDPEQYADVLKKKGATSMKTKEELDALKEEVKSLSEKLSALTEEELEQVTGGVTSGFFSPTRPRCG